MIKKLFFFTISLWIAQQACFVEQPIVVIVPSYNNEKWYFDNLQSILTQQNYSNFRVIYINDCSTDKTLTYVEEYKKNYDVNGKITLINNSTRRGAMANIYHAVHSCHDDEIILLVDGDDRLANNNVFNFINTVYTKEDVWLTYGQYKEWPHGTLGFNKPFSKQVIESNSFRKAQGALPVSHLRTFYAWLFKLIKKEDLMYKNDFFVMTWDKAIMAPMLEMAGFRQKCISDVLYIYNNNNPLNDHRVDKKLQMELMYYILNMPPYASLAGRPG